MAGFSKAPDLAFFLDHLAKIDYVHEPLLAPTDEILDGYRKDKWPWERFAVEFQALMAERDISQTIPQKLFDRPAVLLCSEPTAERCHRRLVAEYLRAAWGGVDIVHI